jgi:hypothetical protein
MKPLLDRYLDHVLLIAKIPETESQSIRRELKDHLLQKIDDLTVAGMPREEATLEALSRHGSPRTIGYQLRKPFPWIDVRTQGTARGVLAIGPKAVGIVAFGGFAVGIFACGGAAFGLVSLGGFALGLLFAFGGFAVGGLVFGGFTMGVVAAGGFSIGIVAEGGYVIGLWVPWAGHAISHYTSTNAPHLLKSLNHLMVIPRLLDQYMMIFWPFCGLCMFTMSLAQSCERRRIKAQNDWLIDS